MGLDMCRAVPYLRYVLVLVAHLCRDRGAEQSRHVNAIHWLQHCTDASLGMSKEICIKAQTSTTLRLFCLIAMAAFDYKHGPVVLSPLFCVKTWHPGRTVYA